MSNFKTIWVFGESSTWKSIDSIVLTNGRIQYFSHAQMRADMNRIEGTRPHLIVNIDKPSDDLADRQVWSGARYEAPIINLYD